MAVREVLAGMPWWVKWIAIPLIALFVFGGLIGAVLAFVAELLFKLLLFVALVGGLVYLVRRFRSSSSSSSGGDW